MCCAKPKAHGLVQALALGLLLLSALSLGQIAPVYADADSPREPLLSQIARTGKLRAGTRTDAAPVAYQATDGQWRGYSIDLLERIRARLQRQLQRPVQLELVAADTNSLALLNQGDVDIVCGSTSFNRNRAMQADFSAGYFVTGTQLLIKSDHDLGAEFTIGVITGTTNQQLIQHYFPIAQFVTVANRAVGLKALQGQRIDALASDGILLEAMRLSLANQMNQKFAALTYATESQPTNAYELVPDQPYNQEYYACMLPQGDEPFRQLVNASLLGFMQGAVASEPEDLQILETWFGQDGMVPIGAEAWANLLDYFHKQLDLQNVPAQQPAQQNVPARQNVPAQEPPDFLQESL